MEIFIYTFLIKLTILERCNAAMSAFKCLPIFHIFWFKQYVNFFGGLGALQFLSIQHFSLQLSYCLFFVVFERIIPLKYSQFAYFYKKNYLSSFFARKRLGHFSITSSIARGNQVGHATTLKKYFRIVSFSVFCLMKIVLTNEKWFKNNTL